MSAWIPKNSHRSGQASVIFNLGQDNQSLFIELSTRGYRKKEPDEGQRETSQMLQKVFAALRDESISKGDIASELCVPFVS